MTDKSERAGMVENGGPKVAEPSVAAPDDDLDKPVITDEKFLKILQLEAQGFKVIDRLIYDGVWDYIPWNLPRPHWTKENRERWLRANARYFARQKAKKEADLQARKKAG